jgi:hypothetical protein
LFKVPEISPEDWLSLPYVQPDELLIYSAVMERYFAENDFTPTDRKCHAEECSGNAIKYTVHCADHHLLSLEKAGAITRKPEGRLLPDYL